MKGKENVLYLSHFILLMFKPFSVSGCSLELLQPGEQGIVAFYKTQDNKILEDIASIEIKIGTYITSEQQIPSLLIKVSDKTISINTKVARTIYVRIFEN